MLSETMAILLQTTVRTFSKSKNDLGDVGSHVQSSIQNEVELYRSTKRARKDYALSFCSDKMKFNLTLLLSEVHCLLKLPVVLVPVCVVSQVLASL